MAACGAMGRARTHPEVIARRGELIVERDPRRPSGRLLRDGPMDSSYVDLADVSHLEFDYMRWMRIVLHAARVRRVVHIGGGACALARALAVADPGGRQEVCEVDADVLELARAHLGLRRARGLHVRLADGRDFIRAQPGASWDAVVVDAFVAAAVPRRLITVEAFSEVASVAPLVLVNVLDGGPSGELRRAAAGLAEVYPEVWSLAGRGGNTVLVATRARIDRTHIRARAAADPAPARITGPAELARLAATTAAWRDADCAEALRRDGGRR